MIIAGPPMLRPRWGRLQTGPLPDRVTNAGTAETGWLAAINDTVRITPFAPRLSSHRANLSHVAMLEETRAGVPHRKTRCHVFR